MKKSIQKLAFLVLLTLVQYSCSKSSDDVVQPPAVQSPESVSFSKTGLYPEGLVYDKIRNRFLVSSLTEGAIYAVKDDGTYTIFAIDNQLISTIGMCIDESRNRVLVAISDPGFSTKTNTATQAKLAAIAMYDLTTGQKIRYVNLGSLSTLPNHFANDITVDGQGNAYVTDSFSGIIYKVDLAGVATIFVENALLAAPAGSFGLNGIVYHPNGYLIISKSDNGKLFKVTMGNTPSVSEITNTTVFSGADGLSLDNNNTLIIACNSTLNTVFKITTSNDWSTGSTSGTFVTGDVFPTTLATRDNNKYVLYGYLGSLFGGQPAVTTFKIQKITF
jgi:sugar lactone lactonase YvrE